MLDDFNKNRDLLSEYKTKRPLHAMELLDADLPPLNTLFASDVVAKETFGKITYLKNLIGNENIQHFKDLLAHCYQGGDFNAANFDFSGLTVEELSFMMKIVKRIEAEAGKIASGQDIYTFISLMLFCFDAVLGTVLVANFYDTKLAYVLHAMILVGLSTMFVLKWNKNFNYKKYAKNAGKLQKKMKVSDDEK